MSFVDDLGTWLLRKVLSALPPSEEEGHPRHPSERVHKVWLREDEYTLLVTILLERFPGQAMAEAIASNAKRRRRHVQISAPRRDLEVVIDVVDELLKERRAESLALLENLAWGDGQAEDEWSDRADLTRRLTSLRDALLQQSQIPRGDRF